LNTDKDTKRRLLESARKEFVEKGYAKASLRSICADSGVTTGALYFFFKDKDDIFESAMKEPLEELFGTVQKHFSEEAKTTKLPEDYRSDTEAARAIIGVLFKRRELYLMLLTRAQGSGLENIRDSVVAFVERHYIVFAQQFSDITGKEFKGRDCLHWVAHNQVDVFIYLLEHCGSAKEAYQLVPGIVAYLTGGWCALFE